MAKFLTTLLSSSNVKQGLEKGPQGIAHAAVGLVEQFATRGVIGRVMPGVGLINPLLGIFTEPVVSALKQQLSPLFGDKPTTALNVVDDTSASKADIGSGLGEDKFSAETFGDLFSGGTILPKIDPTSAVTASLDARRVSGKKFSPEKFDTIRQVLGTNPMAMNTETHGIFMESSQAKVNKAEANGGSNIKATSGVFTSTKEAGNTVLGFAAKDTAADPTLPTGAIPVTNVIDSVFHASLKPQLPPDMAANKFSAQANHDRKIAEGGTLEQVGIDTAARNPVRDPNNPDQFFRGPERTGAIIIGSGLDGKFTKSGVQGTPDSSGPLAFGNPNIGRSSLRKFQKKDAIFGGIINEEFLQQHRFLVFDATGDDKNLSVFEWEDGKLANTLAAGFSFCDAPSMSIQMESIKEGTWEFVRQIPIGVDPGRINLQKGMVRTTTGFYLWIEQFLRGNVTRRTLKILSYGRNLRGNFWNRPEKDRRIYGEWTLYNCAPSRYSAGQGWDARTGEIQTAELEVAYEWFEETSPLDAQRLGTP